MSAAEDEPKLSPSSGAAPLNIRPGVGIIGLFPHMNYKPWFALGELVDNAISSYLQNSERLRGLDSSYRLRVEIEVSQQDGGRVVVRDNAAGIARDDYRRAFVAAEPPPDATGLSQFGIGMKSASCWFARRWQVRTSALGEPVLRDILFDVPQITENGIEELTPVEEIASEHLHYTEIQLWDLHKVPQGRTIGKMAEHIASIYRVFLSRGDIEITFNGRSLDYSQPTILQAPAFDDQNQPNGDPLAWRKTISFELSSGESVTGFAAIRETASTAKAGLALFRHDRLILGSDDEAYRPYEIFGAANKFRYQRVFGELHLSGFSVSHTKDGFIWGDLEIEFQELLRRELDAAPMRLLRQAENYRTRQPSRAQRRENAAALVAAAGAVSSSGAALSAQRGQESTSDELPRTAERESRNEAQLLSIDVGGEEWEVSIELDSRPENSDWVSITSDPSTVGRPRKLGIRIGLASRFMVRFGGLAASEIEPLIRLATGVALAEVTARDGGVSQAGVIRRNLNHLLRGPLSR